MTRRYGLPKTIAGLFLLILFSGCSQPLSTREKSTLVGGGLGAATGAIIGAAVGSPGAGAAIGGALGAGTGALVGDQFQKIENRQNAQQQQISAQRRQIKRQGKEISRLKRQAKKKSQYQTE
jgi:outer membrane lipoprotein SlyB